MFINTHLLIANSIINNINNKNSFFINEKSFLYGNIKPDLPSKYYLQKHYLDESLDMIISKVKYLCSLSLDSLHKNFSVNSFNQELGVICHFLCDFFCVPHSYRWEFKHSMKEHLQYETELSLIAKKTDLLCFKGDAITHDRFEDFFTDMYKQYVNEQNHENDLRFSTYVCNSVVNYILDSILKNSTNSYIIKCG